MKERMKTIFQRKVAERNYAAVKIRAGGSRWAMQVDLMRMRGTMSLERLLRRLIDVSAELKLLISLS